jgi:hypothetical protein
LDFTSWETPVDFKWRFGDIKIPKLAIAL